MDAATTTETRRRAKFLGTTDERTTCECCGRANLKHTVALLIDDALEAVFYGSSCAARALRWTTKEVKAGAKAADDAKAAAARAELERRHAVEAAAWEAHIQASLAAAGLRSTGTRFTDLEALGGYAAVRATYARPVAA